MTSWAKKSRKIKKSFGAQWGFLLEYQIMPILQRCMMPYKTVARFMSHRMRKCAKCSKKQNFGRFYDVTIKCFAKFLYLRIRWDINRATVL